ncbi:MAG: PEGA domain-containing protein [Planctomycetota bacterium]
MRGGLCTALVAVVFAAVGLVAGARGAAGGGTVEITSDPAGASIFCGGEFAGITGDAPVVLSGLPEGVVAIVLKREGYEEFATTVAVSAGAKTVVQATLKRQAAPLLVISRPPGATVSVDGKDRGMTPLLLEDIPVGKHEFLLRLKGFNPWKEEVEIGAGRPEIRVNLEKSDEVEVLPEEKLGEIRATLAAEVDKLFRAYRFTDATAAIEREMTADKKPLHDAMKRDRFEMGCLAAHKARVTKVLNGMKRGPFHTFVGTRRYQGRVVEAGDAGVTVASGDEGEHFKAQVRWEEFAPEDFVSLTWEALPGRDAEALVALGIFCLRTGRFEEGVSLFKEARAHGADISAFEADMDRRRKERAESAARELLDDIRKRHARGEKEGLPARIADLRRRFGDTAAVRDARSVLAEMESAARAGGAAAVVPPVKPEAKDCARCGGTGKVDCPRCKDGTVAVTCATCEGRGRIAVINFGTKKSGPLQEKECPTCAGKGGQIAKCPKCHGDKVVKCVKCNGTGKEAAK